MKFSPNIALAPKGLKTYLRKLKDERGILLLKLQGLNDELRSNKSRIAEVERKIRISTTEGLVVSEHAILRYLERIETIPPMEVPAKIVTPQLIKMVETLGDGLYPIENFQVRVAGNTVVTVYPQNQ